VHSATAVVLFAGSSLSHPLTTDLLAAAAAEQNRIARVLVVGGRAASFGSLRFREGGVRLGWVLTDPVRRGQVDVGGESWISLNLERALEPG
jgi:hypothetical protein